MGTAAQEALTSGSEQTLPSEDGLVTYVVMVKEQVDVEPDEVREAWFDVATVRVKPRTKQRTVIEQGLAEAGIEKTPELEARLLDRDAAHVWKPKAPGPATLRLT